MIHNQLNINRIRKHIYLVMLLVLSLILGKFFQVQTIDEYSKGAMGNPIRSIIINPYRGEIHDRNGKIIVSNRPTFSVQIYPDYYNNSFNKNLFYEMLDSSKKRSSFIIDKNHFENKIKRSAAHIPITIMDYIDFETKVLLNERKIDFPGLIFKSNPARFYSNELRLSHVLGYLRPVSNSLVDNKIYYSNDSYGIDGIEKKYEKELRGKKGVEYHIFSSNGIDHGIDITKDNKPPESGTNILLTIDYDLQLKIESLLKNYKGTIICMNPKNGEVLAMSSSPDYSLTEFIGPLKTKTWEKWKKEQILLNRVVQEHYAPGSIYKLVASIMFLEEGLDPNEKVLCNGVYNLEDQSNPDKPRPFHCWNRSGHGEVNLHDAIKKSCNVYFYDRILKYQEENSNIINVLNTYATKLGFGNKSGLNLHYEIKGKVPTVKSMNDLYRGSRNWSKRGNMPNLIIGQGETTVTPIQVINFINLIATDGNTFKPKLVLDEESIPFNYSLKQDTWNIVNQGMYAVVNDIGGTANSFIDSSILNNDQVNIMGKTGTAQKESLDDDKSEDLMYISWFAGYIEMDDNIMSITVMLDDVNKDSKTLAKKISNQIFDYYISYGISNPNSLTK